MIKPFGLTIFSALILMLPIDIAYAKTCPPGQNLQIFYGQLNSLNREHRVQYAAGNFLEAMRVKRRIDILEAKHPFLFFQQEIRNFPLIGDVFCLIAAMKAASGQNLFYQPYSNGKLDLLLDGKVIRQMISKAELFSIAKSLR